jgi:hypothetical protein
MNLHPDVVKAMSVFIDIDDIGSDKIRKLVAEDVLCRLKQSETSEFLFKFLVEEHGWHAWFILVVNHDSCLLRFPSIKDFDNYWTDTIPKKNPRKKKNLEILLPPVYKMAVEDLVAGINAFLVCDVMDE